MGKKICFIHRFPPPMHGLSKAVEMIYDAELKWAQIVNLSLKK